MPPDGRGHAARCRSRPRAGRAPCASRVDADARPRRGRARQHRRPRARRALRRVRARRAAHEDRRRRLAALAPADRDRQLHPRLARRAWPRRPAGGTSSSRSRRRACAGPARSARRSTGSRSSSGSCRCPPPTRCAPPGAALGRPAVERLAGRLDAFLFSEWMYPGAARRRARDRLPRPRAAPSPRVVHAADDLDAHAQGPSCRPRRATSSSRTRSFTADDLDRDARHRAGADRASRTPGSSDGLGAGRRRAPTSGRPTMLGLGTIEPRKNIARLVEAWRLLDGELGLVLAGGEGWGDRPDLADPRIRRLGYVPDEEIAAPLPRRGRVVYPSLFEGFGMPIVEAMACGTPVVASSHPSLDEACGDAAVRVDPLDAGGDRRRASARRSRGATSSSRSGSRTRRGSRGRGRARRCSRHSRSARERATGGPRRSRSSFAVPATAGRSTSSCSARPRSSATGTSSPAGSSGARSRPPRRRASSARRRASRADRRPLGRPARLRPRRRSGVRARALSAGNGADRRLAVRRRRAARLGAGARRGARRPPLARRRRGDRAAPLPGAARGGAAGGGLVRVGDRHDAARPDPGRDGAARPRPARGARRAAGARARRARRRAAPGGSRPFAATRSGTRSASAARPPRLDVLHCTTFRAPRLGRGRRSSSRCTTSASCAIPEAFPRWHRATGARALRGGVRAADAVVAVSAFTRDELVDAARRAARADPRRPERRRSGLLAGRAAPRTATTSSPSGRSSRGRTSAPRSRRRASPASSSASPGAAGWGGVARAGWVGEPTDDGARAPDARRALPRLPVALRGLRHPDRSRRWPAGRRSSRAAAARPRRSPVARRCSSTRATRPRSPTGSRRPGGGATSSSRSGCPRGRVHLAPVGRPRRGALAGARMTLVVSTRTCSAGSGR